MTRRVVADGREQKEEADRAAILHDLYSLRAKLSQQDNASLMKARERINALAAERGC